VSIIEKAANRFEQVKGEITRPLKVMPEPRSLGEQSSKIISDEQSSTIINEHSARNPGRQMIAQADINLARLHQLGMITPDQGKTLAAQEFRGIKRSLIQNAFIKGAGAIHHGNLIMVTCSLPREGKTFCAINLAMSIATEMDHTVLLIDADVARPSVLRTLGLKSAVGLMYILLDEKLD
jgi:Mrp family chromosome partitioning ATPase